MTDSVCTMPECVMNVCTMITVEGIRCERVAMPEVARAIGPDGPSDVAGHGLDAA